MVQHSKSGRLAMLRIPPDLNIKNILRVISKAIRTHNISKYKSRPFSSLVRPDTDDSFSSNVLSFITRSALTNIFFLKGFTISSLKTLCTSSYCGQSFSFGGLKSHYTKTFMNTFKNTTLTIYVTKSMFPFEEK